MESILNLCKIGKEVDKNEAETCEESFRIFEHEGKYWELLEFFDHNDLTKLIEVLKLKIKQNWKRREKFAFVEEKQNGSNYLVVIYNSANKLSSELEQMFLLQKLFPIIFKNFKNHLNLGSNNYAGITEEAEDKDYEVPPVKRQKLMKKYITTQLYDALYHKHLSISRTGKTENILELPLQLKPTLRHYQKRTLNWLLSREREIERFPSFYMTLQAKDNEHKPLYLHKFYLRMQNVLSPPIELPPGGILADEMGLGKTVEMLALILCHPRLKLSSFCLSSESNCKQMEKTVFCICNLKSSEKKLVQCTKCCLWQHVVCVCKYNDQHGDEINDPYLCPSCWNDITQNSQYVETRATFIVSPNTIKMQWLSEIRRHTSPSLRVLLYDGVVTGNWISPRQLADYDVVLTDYNVLRNEIYHTSEYNSDRITRNKPRSMRMYTPLLMLQWWRVCLDEAQMIESGAAKAETLVRMLPAINRWAVTGTPISANIDDLHYLLDFIGFEEVCYPKNVWKNLVLDFMLNNGEAESAQNSALISVLQKCMWRTCKSKVIDELHIPPQTEVVHRIYLSNLEKLYYMEQHALCETNFYQLVDKYIDSQEEELLSISPNVMKNILQPLLKIRQCCSIPVVMIAGKLTKKNVLVSQKQFLHPKDLHKHLKSANEIDCKSELRTMASSYNGLAAIYFIRKNYDDAIKHYELVLRLAYDYKDINLSLDTLLQLHALHNILQAYYASPKYAEQPTTETTNVYEQEYNVLEWKYLEPYASTMATAKSAFLAANETLSKIRMQTESDVMESLNELVPNIIGDEQLHGLLMNKICDDLFPLFSNNAKIQELRSIHGVLYTLDVWFTKVGSVQQQLMLEIQNLKYFTDNVRSRNEIETIIWNQMMQFVASVYDCHLNGLRDNKKSSTKKASKEKKTLCKLCIIQSLLNKLECLLFNKVIDKSTNLTEGLENPSMEVALIKVIYTFTKGKYKLQNFIKNIEKNWESLEAMQIVCKKFIKFWIEIEYTVKAYDELNMCKMRISITTDNDEKSNYRILEYEIDDMFTEQQLNLYEAQRKFSLKLARLKYIMHLEADADPGPCPICRSEDDERYAVLECGHPICLPCLRSMRNYMPNHQQKMICPICRYQQNSKQLYFVNRAPTNVLEEQIQIAGHYSSKITYIVRLILKLKSETEFFTPKILIFSQWLEILNAIAAALQENDVRYRLLKSPQTIEEFKSSELGITCLLMPLSRGAKGLNLIEATHVFLVEPILNPGEELQAIGRIHRFGQTKPTTVHRFIVSNTIEENVFNVVAAGKQSKVNWEFNNMTVESLRNLFKLKNNITDEY